MENDSFKNKFFVKETESTCATQIILVCMAHIVSALLHLEARLDSTEHCVSEVDTFLIFKLLADWW
jgi:hypothetical protein